MNQLEKACKLYKEQAQLEILKKDNLNTVFKIKTKMSNSKESDKRRFKI